MQLAQFVTLLVTFVTGFGFVYREIKFMEAKIDGDIKAQAARTDKLYEMFIDLVKERK